MFNPKTFLDQHVSRALKKYGTLLETHFKSDVISYTGVIHTLVIPHFKELIEVLQAKKPKTKQENPERLVIILTTGGGLAEAVEKMVEITRKYYKEIFFIVPDAAMSAGTIWCMSGDRIYMDYASSLGPIDPQVQSADNKFVPALGYIDKVNEFIEKSRDSTLSDAEYMLIKSLDLGLLRRYEQARDLSISLLQEWLVKYKFKDWSKHRTTNPGTPVTQLEKEERAKEIAEILSDNKKWHSHGRMIGIETLRNILKLEIEDYSENKKLRENIIIYNGLISDYVDKQQLPVMIHNARV